MHLERLLQINMATLAALGTLLLGMGQRSVELPLLVLVTAISSVWLTDTLGLLKLNRAVANLAALVAVIVSLRQLFLHGGQVQLLGLANLLVYLQVILLFQEKDLRSYRQLVMLSFLQVVVAALYSQGFWFGVVVVVYVLVGISALALLLAFRQWEQHRGDAEPATGSWPGSSPGSSPGGGRWPLSARQPGLSAAPAGAAHAGVVRELYLRLGLLGVGTVTLTVLLFLTMPRLGQSAWRGAASRTRHVVGFSPEVTLGEMGEILQSREEVLRLTLSDPHSEATLRVRGDLYLRGSVLTDYDRGRWKNTKPSPYPGGRLPSLASAAGRPLVVQQITIEPLDSEELFCLWPPVELQPDERLRLRRGRLVRPRVWRRRRMVFALGTTAIAGGEQAALVPCEEILDVRRLSAMPEESPLKELRRLAAEWIAESGLPTHDRIGRARYLCERFHDPGRFEYSLQGQTRERGVDPVEDFVASNPQGHCEYFATALALMLRSQGIPSRVVAGFRCDEFNELGEYYQVRQYHAHSWVEAYLRLEDLPLNSLSGAGASRFAAGAWLRLEPTPAAPGALVGEDTSLAGRLRRGFDRLGELWSEYVLEMDRRRQQHAVYQPVARTISRLSDRLRDPAWWRAVGAKLAGLLHLSALGAIGGWLATLLIVAAVAGAAVLLRRRVCAVWRRVWARLAGRPQPTPRHDPARVDFYRRFEVLLARTGHVRRPAETQREFAAAAGAALAAATGRPQVRALVVNVADAFYRVRFGNLPLDTDSAAAVERALGELNASVAGRTAKQPRRNHP